MRTGYMLVLVFGLALGQATPVWAQGTPIPGKLAENAALQYWQAFECLPPFANETPDWVLKWDTLSLDDPKRQDFIKGLPNHEGLKFLHRGVKLAECDWGLDYNDGISLMMPHLAACPPTPPTSKT